MTTIQQLKWSSLTPAVNEIKSPNMFLKRLMFSNHVTLPTETVEIDVLTQARETVPFVKVNGEAIMIQGHGETFQTVKAPNIRVKRAFTPSELLFNRRPGTTIFIDAGGIQAAVNRHIATDLQVMADKITNTEEWLCSMALQGVISYAVADGDVFQITLPKPAANKITLTTFWDDPDPTAPDVDGDFHTVKKVISDAVGLGVTHVLLGQAASTAFRKVVKKQNLYGLMLPGATYGQVDYTAQFTQDGAVFIGVYAGVQVWEYSRTVSIAGVATPIIRSKYAEFLSITPAAENVLYYAAIPDLETLGALPLQAERFAKAWTLPDPSAYMALVHSRPLPITRRPGSTVSMKVCA